MHSLKSYTANELNKLTQKMGTVWQREYFDRFIRTESHYFNTLKYIHENPVVANLCRTPEEYTWSRATVSRIAS